MARRQSVPREWRRFELLVARLESVLRPAGCVLRSPDHLLDVETGELREVDCSITMPVDSGVGRMSIECRKRSVKQDVTWIEQLATKRRALGLDRTIAVASRGFSRAAYRKARHHGIVLHTYRELECGMTTSPLSINHVRLSGTIVDFTFEVADEDPQPGQDLLGLVEARAASPDPTTPLLRHIDTDGVITVQAVLRTLLRHVGAIDDAEAEKNFAVRFQRPTTFIDFPDSIPLESLRLKIKIIAQRRPFTELSFGEYSDEVKTLLEVAQGKTKVDDKEVRLELFYRILEDPSAGPTEVAIPVAWPT